MTKNILLIIEIQAGYIMKNRLIIDGNAVYEIDEECMRKKNDDEKNNIKINNKNNKKNKKRYK